jgi:hypothetical protein
VLEQPHERLIVAAAGATLPCRNIPASR